eukprot:1653809-Prymnesium_polylepis.1
MQARRQVTHVVVVARTAFGPAPPYVGCHAGIDSQHRASVENTARAREREYERRYADTIVVSVRRATWTAHGDYLSVLAST